MNLLISPHPKKRNRNIQAGFFLLDKPSGLTSRAALNQIKRSLSIQKIGHTGTLDKFASGLQIIPFGAYTSFADAFLKQDKTYRFTASYGTYTDSGDSQGDVLRSWTNAEVAVYYQKNRSEILRRTQEIQEWKEQIPPKISALKVGGKRQSDLYRSGISFASKSRPMEIYKLQVLQLTERELEVEIHVSSGTYIRKLVMDLSDLLGLPMHVSRLRRLSVGDLGITQASTLQDTCAGNARVYSVTELLPLPTVAVTAEEKLEIQYGRYLPHSYPFKKFLFIDDKSQKVLAWCESTNKKENSSYRYLRVFSVPE
ncbi:MAG: tRNA pseudouridine(55) synthase TruB [Spirochaetota bacterium]